MSGETAQIAQIAVKASDEIFSHFGWKRTGPNDHNFKGYDIPDAPDSETDGEAPEGGASTTKPVAPATEVMQERDFPADVVFSYSDPYTDYTVFIHFDLKSYGKTSLKSSTTRKALKSLSKAIQVAESSQDWRSKYAAGASNYNVHGGLFVYNHDNEAVDRIDDFLAKLRSTTLPIPEGKRLYVFTPRRINYLLTLIQDTKALIADGILPRANEGEITVFYPYGVHAKPQKSLLNYATAEQLLAPFLVRRFQHTATNKRGYVVHYDGKGEAIDEYLFLFEMFLKRGLLTDEGDISLRLINGSENALSIFNEAKDFFIRCYHELPGFKEQMNRIVFSRVTNIVKVFETVDLGMERK